MLKHMTATVYLVAKINGEAKVLLHHHTKHNMWVGVGGHMENYENPQEAAVREVKEEAGIDVTLFNENKDLIKTQSVTELIRPFMIQEQKISARGFEAEHRHIDCIYFAVVDNPEAVTMQEEFKWVSLADLQTLELEKEVRHNAENALKIIT